MRITDVKVVNLCYQYPRGKGFRYAGGVASGRLTSLVRVKTDEGIEGVGSAYSNPDMVRCVIEGNLRDILIGDDPTEVRTLWHKMYKITRWYGRKGAAMSALGGVDTALWDIRGKVLGKPVWEMLGAHRDSVPAYASALLWKEDPADLGAEAAHYVQEGYRAVKMHLVASLPNGITVEVDRTGNPFIDELLTEPLVVRDGEIPLPTGPGLGIELDEDLLDAYALPPDAPIPDGNYADMVFGREHYVAIPPYETP